MAKSLEELEAESHLALGPYLSRSRILLNSVCELVGKSALTLRKEDLSANSASQVAVLLGIRLTNDARGVSLLARIGYGMQAAALASSIYELAYTVAYIAGDNGLADQWFDHDRVRSTPFGDLFKMTEESLRKLGLTAWKNTAVSEYQIYSQLCMAKHGNPILQSQHGFKLVGNKLTPRNGPDTSDHSVRVCRFAVDMSAASILIALQSFILNQVPKERRSPLQLYHDSLQNEALTLRRDAVKLWGNVDPSPGGWRTK